MKLQSKILLVIFALALLSGGMTIGLSRRAVEAIVTRKLTHTGLAQATVLADTCASGFEHRSEDQLLSALQIAQKLSGASFVAALDPSGLVLAHTNVAEKGQRYSDPERKNLLQANHPQVLVTWVGGDPIMEVSAPVWRNEVVDPSEKLLFESAGPFSRQRLGSILLAIPLRDMLETKTQIVRQLALILIVIIGLGLLVTLPLIKGFLRPIRTLLSGHERIALGEYGAQIQSYSNDELGELARSFNRMSAILGETSVSRDFLGDILASMLDPLLVLEPDGRIRMTNDATRELLGYPENELLGQPADRLTGEPGTIGRSAVKSLELLLMTKQGKKIPVLYSSSLLKNKKGEVTGVIGIAKDMTERKRLETMIRQSDKMSAVGQLAAGVAHEINNPLGIILGFAQSVARRVKEDDPLAMPLKSIEREAIRCKNLVQDLLTFSRASQDDRVSGVDANMAIRESLSLIQSRSKTSNVQLIQELDPSLPSVKANKNQLQQVIINLCNNAIDAMPQGGKITLSTCVSPTKAGHVEIHVRDTGAGIPPEVQSRIFEPFFTTKEIGKGTGLGLSLVYEIVQKHNGFIELHSEIGGGTTFTVYLPVESGPAMTAR